MWKCARYIMDWEGTRDTEARKYVSCFCMAAHLPEKVFHRGRGEENMRKRSPKEQQQMRCCQSSNQDGTATRARSAVWYEKLGRSARLLIVCSVVK